MALYTRDKKTEPSSSMFAATPCYTTLVPGAWTNDRLGPDTPRGVLGGMVATLSGGDYTVNIASDTTTVDYLFYNDAAGAPFENAPSVASGKIALLPLGRGDVVEVDVYETHAQAAGHASVMILYTINRPLYVSSNGMITAEAVAGSKIVGRCVKVPTTASPRLGIMTKDE
jgi:hypothetical protein